MRSIHILTLSVAIALLVGCKKDEEAAAPQDQFVDRLTLGTGMSGFTITGESTTFTRVGGSVMLFWRLESSVDMAGSSVKIRVDRLTGGTAAPFDSATYSNPQTYGHIMLSSYVFGGAVGNYRATGILQASGRVVASKDFIVQ